jgi:hypothetical protein
LQTSLAINKGGSQTVNNVPKPQDSGQATVEVIVGGQTLASTTIQLQ